MMQVNLLPWRERIRKRLISQTIAIFLVILTLCLTIVVIATLYLKSNNQNYYQMITQIKRQNQNMLIAIGKTKESQNQLNLLLQQREFINDLRQQNAKTVRLLYSLVQWLPEQVWLKAVSLQRQKVTIEGHAFYYQALVHFIDAIRNSTEFGNVTVDHITQTKAARHDLQDYLNFKSEATW